MDKICCIFDFQGFVLDGKFLVRELGWADMSSSDKGVIKFNLRSHMQGISQKDQDTIRYNENKIHGMSFVPESGEAVFDPSLLETKIKEIHNGCKKEGRDYVVYKGGERKHILENLLIPNRNLEKFGCPKYVELKKYHKGNSCGCHKSNLPCSLELVNAYRSWMRENMKDFTFSSSEEDETDESE